jgi:hypothetical protein
MAQSPTQVEERAIAQGWAVIKRRMNRFNTCANIYCLAQVSNLGDYCPQHQNDMNKGEFRGYSKNNLEGRAERQAKRRVWGKSRKNKSKRTTNRYKRSQIRGSGSGARPKMRRELGAGGKRPMRNR